MSLVLPQPPAKYDYRDQVEIRRLIELEVRRLQQEVQQLRDRILVLEGGPP